MFLTQPAFHKFEDQLHTRDVNEQKRNRLHDAEGGLDPCGISDSYALYRVPTDELSAGPWNEVYRDAYNTSNQALPLVANATPFQRSDLYDDDFENKSAQSEDYNVQSRFTSQHDETNSHFGSESYAPSRNMF